MQRSLPRSLTRSFGQALPLVLTAMVLQSGSWVAAVSTCPLLLSFGLWTQVPYAAPPGIVEIPVPSGIPEAGLRASLLDIYWPSAPTSWTAAVEASPPELLETQFCSDLRAGIRGAGACVGPRPLAAYCTPNACVRRSLSRAFGRIRRCHRAGAMDSLGGLSLATRPAPRHLPPPDAMGKHRSRSLAMEPSTWCFRGPWSGRSTARCRRRCLNKHPDRHIRLRCIASVDFRLR